MAGYGINWGLLQQPDIGNAFTQGFTTGRTKATLGALSKDPNDTNALNALMQTNPDAGFEFQDRQIRQQDRQASIAKSQQEQQAVVLKRRALAAKGAKDPQTWDAVAQQLVALGDAEAGQAIGKFTPEYRMAVMASGGVEDDDAKEPDVVRQLRAAGINEDDPRWQEAILNHVAPPTFTEFGSDATGRRLLQTRGMGSWGGGRGGGQPAPGGAPTGAQIETAALSLIPGATVTSRARTPQHNRAVGGVPNSYHVTDQARDLVPPRGMTMSQFYQTLKGSMPGFQVINEGDHVHIEPTRRGGQQRGEGGLPVVASTPPVPKEPKFQAPRLSAAEVAQEGLAPGVYYRNENGIPQRVDKDGDAKDAPYSQSAIDAFNRAISTAGRLKSHPGMSSAVGVKGLSGGLMGGWVVPGTDAADFRAELDAMKAQVFLPMVQSMKGMGALSNAEGEKLTAAIGALDPKMSEGQFKASLDRIVGDLTTYRDRGMPKKQGGASPPAGAIQMLKQNPNLRSAFDAKYGPGASSRVLGK